MALSDKANKLHPAQGHVFESGKVYTHAHGLSCTFRQWRADHSHCRFLHGYSLQVTITFGSMNLDRHNWVMDFGGLKWVKEWLEATFDHKTLVAKDDPQLEVFKALACTDDSSVVTIPSLEMPVIDLMVVEHVGCEAFAKMIFHYVDQYLLYNIDNEAWVQSVKVEEHPGNFAIYRKES